MFPVFVLAYGDTTTHPALTQETVQFFNTHYPKLALTEEEMKFIMQGSTDEDRGTRALQHFYDPVYNKGLVLLGNEFQKTKEWAEDTNAQATYYKNTVALSLYASLYGIVVDNYSGDADFTWERAIYEYAWGDKERALTSLGHVLHLLQDASVPDHTRNDPHPPVLDFGSPYEFWTKRFNPVNIDIISKLRTQKPVPFSTLGEYFDTIAIHSNNKFFSKDTTPDKKVNYEFPIISIKSPAELKDGRTYQFGYWQDQGDMYKLALVKEDAITLEREYFVTDPDNLILSDYWSRLSEHTVLHSAGAVKLFFEEVEKEKKTQELYKKKRSLLGKLYDATTSALEKITNPFFQGGIPGDGAENTGTQFAALGSLGESEQGSNATENNSVSNDGFTEQSIQNREGESSGSQPSPLLGFGDSFDISNESGNNTGTSNSLGAGEAQDNGNTQNSNAGLPTPYSPGFGGGGGVRNAESTTGSSSTPGVLSPTQPTDGGANEQDDTDSVTDPSDITPPQAPTVTSPSGLHQIFTASSILFEGEAEASSTVTAQFMKGGVMQAFATTSLLANATSTVGMWAFEFSLDQGTTTIEFFAKDRAQNISSGTLRTFYIDSEAPEIILESPECAHSLSISRCIVSPRDNAGGATTTLNFFWNSSSTDLSFFNIFYNDTLSTTTATSTVVYARDNAITYFSVSAVDHFGNEGATSTLAVEVATRPVVINEIAWMGTEASSADEWIELFNTTSEPITLDENWVLYSADDRTPYLTLRGVIPSKGYYLIERKNVGEIDEATESPVTDISADLWTSFSFGLNNNSETLILARASTTIDEVSKCGTRWCGGTSGSFGTRTMERYDHYGAGTDRENWGTNNLYIANGVDTNGATINGTPKTRNSISHQITNGTQLTGSKTLTKGNSPYLITDSGFLIQNGATLIAEPGVVVKLVSGNEPPIEVEGTFITRGTEEEPVVITAFTDDEYGGDLNADGPCEPDNASSTSECPFPGSWKQIRIWPTSVGSSFMHTIVRYGGRYFTNTQLRGAIGVQDASVYFDHLTVEYALLHGLYLANATAEIHKSTFRNNANENASAGVYAASGAVTITDSLFEENAYGLYLSDASLARIESNTFLSNIRDPINVRNGAGIFTGNRGEDNGRNAIVIVGEVTMREHTTTLGANPLSYFLEDDVHVVLGSTLVFEKGVVIKSHARVNNRGGALVVDAGGRLIGEAENFEDLIFTSHYDDSIGSIVYSATTSPKAGDWVGIEVRDGGELHLKGFTMRYAGEKMHRNTSRGALKFDAGSATSTITNALFEENFQYGVWFHGGTNVLLKDSLLRHHREKEFGEATAIWMEGGGSIELNNITLEDNEIDISVFGETVNITADDTTKNRLPITIPAGLLE